MPFDRNNEILPPPGTEKAPSKPIYGMWQGPQYQGMTAQEAWDSAFALEAARKKHQDQQMLITAIALVVFFGGLFLITFIAKRRRQIANAGEGVVVSAIASVVRAKRKASRYSDRLKSKVSEKLDNQ